MSGTVVVALIVVAGMLAAGLVVSRDPQQRRLLVVALGLTVAGLTALGIASVLA